MKRYFKFQVKFKISDSSVEIFQSLIFGSSIELKNMYINRKVLLPFSYWDNPESNLTMYSEFSDLVYISKVDFVKITEKLIDTNSLIFKIFASKKISQSTKNATVRIGGFHNEDSKIIFAPRWVIEQINNGVTLNKDDTLNTSFISSDSESSETNYGIRVHMIQIFNAPIATSIKIQVLNPEKLSMFSNLNVREIYQKAFENYGGVEFERTIPLLLNIQEDFEMDVEVKLIQIEPMSINGYVRFDGDVVLDFQEPEEPVTPDKPVELPEKESVVLSKEELRKARLNFFGKSF